MSVVSASQSGDLFSKALIQSYIQGRYFIERPWLAKQIEEALADPACRFLLLTAAPGAGKTAFIAWLAQQHTSWPRYFIRRDQLTPLGDVGARSFLLQIGFQLAASYPAIFTREGLKVVVEQRIETVSREGEAVGAEVEKFFASPFFQVAFQIQQQVTQNNGSVVGIRIGEWITDPRLMSLDDLQYMALIDPARVLLAQSPDEQIVILVDALDELRYRAPDQTLSSWLVKCSVLPPNVRFVLTSRPDDELLRGFREAQRPWLKEVTIAATDPNVLLDLHTYALNLTGEQKVKDALERAEQTVEGFVDQAMNRANGNIGYLDAVERAIEQALMQNDVQTLTRLLNLSKLPDTLEGLYASFLHQLKDLVRGKEVEVEDPETGQAHYLPLWSFVYRDILGILAVAREPLTTAQLRNLGSIHVDWGDLSDAMNALRQFLNREGNRYSLYHTTLIEFLTAEETHQSPDTQDLYLDAMKWHGRIVSYYRGKAQTWEEVAWNKIDDYGLRNLGAHLYALRNIGAYEHDLYTLICKPFFLESYYRFRSLQSMSQIVALAIEVAENEEPPNIVQMARGSLLYTTLGQLAMHVPPGLLAVLVQLDQESTAIEYASMMQGAEKGDAYRSISNALFVQGKPDQARALLKQATPTPEVLVRAGEIDQSLTLIDALASQAQTLSGSHSQASQDAPGIALSEVLHILSTAGPINRAQLLIDSLEDGYAKMFALSEVAQSLARTGQVKQALDITSTITDAYRKAITLSRIVQAIVRLHTDGDAQEKTLVSLLTSPGRQAIVQLQIDWGAQDIANQALTVAQTISLTPQSIFGEGDKAVALCEVAQALVQVGKNEDAHAKAVGILTEAEAIVVTAGDTPFQRHGENQKIAVLPRLKQKQNMAQQNQVNTNQMNTTPLASRLAEELARQEEAHQEIERVAGLTNMVSPHQSALNYLKEPKKQSGRATNLKARILQLLQEEGEHALDGEDAIGGEGNQALTEGQVAQRQAEIQADLNESYQSFKAAQEQASEAREEYNRAYLLEKVVHAWAQIGQVDRALQAADRIQRKENKAGALCKVASILIQAGDTEGAKDTAIQALGVAKSINSAIALSEVARVLFEAGEAKDAEDVVREALAAVDVTENEYEYRNAGMLCEMISLLALWVSVEQVLATANKASGELRSHIMTDIAQALLQVGRKEPAGEIATQALKIGVSSGREKDYVKYDFATLARLGNLRGVEITRLEGTAEAITSKVCLGPSEYMQLLGMIAMMGFQENVLQNEWQSKVIALRSVARALASVGRADQSQEVAMAIHSQYWKAFALSEVTSILAQTGQMESAKSGAMQADALVKALFSSKSPRFPVDDMKLLIETARALLQVGEIERARALVEQAFELAQKELSGLVTSISTDVLHSFIQLLIQVEDKVCLLHLAMNAIEFTGERPHDSETDEMLGTPDMRGEAAYIVAQVEQMKHTPVEGQLVDANQDKVNVSNETLQLGGQVQLLHKLKTAFKDASLSGRDSILAVLQLEASTLSTLDQGQTLWQLYESMQELDHWFGIP